MENGSKLQKMGTNIFSLIHNFSDKKKKKRYFKMIKSIVPLEEQQQNVTRKP